MVATRAGALPRAKFKSGPSTITVHPKAHAVKPLNVQGKGKEYISDGGGPSLPSRTGKPWPGGGKVPTPDTGNQEAKRVTVRVTPGGAAVHYHVST